MTPNEQINHALDSMKKASKIAHKRAADHGLTVPVEKDGKVIRVKPSV